MRRLTTVVLALALLAVPLVADEPNEQKKETTIEQLMARIEKLEERITALEGRSLPPAQLPDCPPTPRMIPAPGLQFVPPSRDGVPQQLGVPDGWKQFEFNGQYFYVIPADRSGPAAP